VVQDFVESMRWCRFLLKTRRVSPFSFVGQHVDSMGNQEKASSNSTAAGHQHCMQHRMAKSWKSRALMSLKFNPYMSCSSQTALDSTISTQSTSISPSQAARQQHPRGQHRIVQSWTCGNSLKFGQHMHTFHSCPPMTSSTKTFMIFHFKISSNRAGEKRIKKHHFSSRF